MGCFLEFGFGDVELGVEGVFPDVVCGGRLGDVVPAEEDLELSFGWEGFDGAVGGEFEGEFLELAGGENVS